MRVCRHLLLQLDVKHTNYRLWSDIENHVDYPSLLTVKDTLGNYGIDSAAVRKGNLSYADFETPFICSIQHETWPMPAFTLVTQCDAETIGYFDPTSDKLVKCALKDFEKIDKEVLLLLDAEDKKDEPGYHHNRITERNNKILSVFPFIVLFLLISFSVFSQLAYTATTWLSSYFTITSTLGLAISCLLVWHSVDDHNPFLKEVCGGQGRKINCNAVLSSKGASFLGTDWSAWGFSFFLTSFLCNIFISGQAPMIAFWAAVNIIASLFIPYSIYYQAVVVKQWCPLCLGILAVLLVNLGGAALFLMREPNPWAQVAEYRSVIVILLGLLVWTLTMIAIPLIREARDSKNYETRWKKLKYHPDIFHSFLEKSNKIPAPPDDLGIVVGNPDASLEIIKVCNPYCGPCSKAHPELDRLVKNNANVKIRIIFTATGDGDDRRTLPVSHLLAIHAMSGAQKVRQALDDWYMASQKNYEQFSAQYPVNGELAQQQHKIHAMRDWCNAMKIRATPTIFINGYELPETYRVTDLKNFF